MMKYSAYTCDLVLAIESAFPTSWKTPAIFIDSICPNKQPGKSKEFRNEEMRSNSQKESSNIHFCNCRNNESFPLNDKFLKSCCVNKTEVSSKGKCGILYREADSDL